MKTTVLIIFLSFPSVVLAETTKTQFNPFTGKLDYITQVDSTTLPSGSTQYVQSSPAAQQTTQFNTSSGTVNVLNVTSTATFTNMSASVFTNVSSMTLDSMTSTSFTGVSTVTLDSGIVPDIGGNLILRQKVTTYNNVLTQGYGVAAITAYIALTNQGADVGSTNFSNAGTAGIYQIGYSLEDTTSDLSAGAIQLAIAFTDDAGAGTVTASQVLTGVGRVAGVAFIQLASGNISYSTTHTGLFGSAKYAVYMTCERMN